MKLFLNSASPFARMALISAITAELTHIELHFVDPWSNPQALVECNPFSQIPALLTDSGHTLYQTPIICQMLRPDVFRDPNQLQQFAYASSLVEMIVKAFVLTHFNQPHAPEHPITARAIQTIIHVLPKSPKLQADSNNLSQFMLACAFDYLTLRLPHLTTYLSKTNLEALEQMKTRNIMRLTHTDHLINQPKNVLALGLNPSHWKVSQ